MFAAPLQAFEPLDVVEVPPAIPGISITSYGLVRTTGELAFKDDWR